MKRCIPVINNDVYKILFKFIEMGINWNHYEKFIEWLMLGINP